MIAEELQTLIAAASFTTFHPVVLLLADIWTSKNSLFIKNYQQNILNFSDNGLEKTEHNIYIYKGNIPWTYRCKTAEYTT